MGKTLRRVGGMLVLLALVAPPPAWPRMVRIETTAPLSDHSDKAIERALESALDSCVRGATAMGLSWIWLDRAVVSTDKVIVRMVATDEQTEGDESVFDSTPAPSSF